MSNPTSKTRRLSREIASLQDALEFTREMIEHNTEPGDLPGLEQQEREIKEDLAAANAEYAAI